MNTPAIFGLQLQRHISACLLAMAALACTSTGCKTSKVAASQESAVAPTLVKSTVAVDPLSFSATPNWSAKFDEGPDGWWDIDFVSLSGARLELGQHSPDRKGEAANSMLRWEYLSEGFAGESCKGRYSVFTDREPCLVIIMMSVDDMLWSGTFRGSLKDWENALALLKTAKRMR
ncbi:hypothetical protein [Pedosphaera parvula]|uniref:Uncharacterized protein n=1 Tax=Pedosphaera parvula (strain Ellin514) TaxID=320771 RepID=B9XKA5_PEDPL|nr:hypothetical protein [Pedosphaera parvula]EEF59743.1 hypothetical protein Cflav_PD2564 [Pedosphaera parvula Ellin514]